MVSLALFGCNGSTIIIDCPQELQCPILLHPSLYLALKTSTYGKHWISQRVVIVARKLKKIINSEWKILFYLSCVTYHISCVAWIVIGSNSLKTTTFTSVKYRNLNHTGSHQFILAVVWENNVCIVVLTKKKFVID